MTPATPAVQSSSVHAHQEALAVEAARPAPGSPGNLAISSAEPLGARLRKRASSGQHAAADSAIPPRPASASPEGDPRPGTRPPASDDYETTQISGGFASSLGALVKVTAVLVGVTLAVALPLLWWTDLWPVSPAGTQIADSSPKKHDASPITPTVAATSTASETAKPELSPVASAHDVGTTKPEAAPVPSSASTVAEAPAPKPSSAPVVVAQVGTADKDKVEPVKIDSGPKVSADVSGDSDIDIRKVESLRADGVRLYRQGKFDEAIAKFDALLQMSPRDADALFRRGLALHVKGDLAAAETAYELAATRAGPRDARAWNNLGLVREDRGQIEQARTAYERGLAANPHDASVLTNLGRLERDAHPDKALELYERALKEEPRHPWARYERASVVALALRPGDEGARKELEALSGEDSPARARALDTLATVVSHGPKPADAERLYRRALDADPSLVEVRLHLGVLLYATGQNDKAEVELRAYLEKNPKSADAWKTLGAALVRLDRLPEAKAAYERALAENDKDVTTLYNYALCAERFGNFLFAIQEYERVVQLDAKHWKALQNLGLLYRHAGRYEKALEYFTKAIAVQPANADLHLQRANALRDLNREAEELGELQEFVRLAPAGDKRADEVRRSIGVETPPAATSASPPEKRDGPEKRGGQ
jgi:tetratricopeptide (TPR) repeat protein